MMRAQIYMGKDSHGNAIAELSALMRNPEACGQALVLRAIALALVSDLDQALAEVNNVIAELPHETAYPAQGDISARSIRLPSRWAKVC